MKKQFVTLAIAAGFLMASGSFARADTYTIDSTWHTGSTQFNNLVQYTGDGTFTWNGTSFSNIVFTFVSGGTTTLWTATSTDGELLNSNKELIIGNGPSDCSGSSCVSINFASAITTGSALTLAGTGGTTQDPNTTFDSATLIDTSFGGTPEPSSIVLLLSILAAVGLVATRKRELSKI